MKPIISLSLLAVILTGPAAAEIPVRDFARFAEFENVKLSPKGDYVAVTTPIDDHTPLAIVRLSDGAVTGGLNFGKYDHITNFWWVGPDRVVVTLAIRNGYLDAPGNSGELVAINADGKRKKYLFGYRGRTSDAGLVAFMVDPLPNDPEWALIKVWGRNREFHKLFRINVYTGVLKQELRPPAEYISGYLTDNRGRVRYVSGRSCELRNLSPELLGGRECSLLLIR